MMRDDFAIRTYSAADRDAVVALNRYGLEAAGVPPESDVYAGDLDDVEATYQVGRAVMLVGEMEGFVVAMGAIREIDSETCEILRMRVDPRYQGRGYGRTMLNALEEHALKRGYKRAVLLTGPDQHPAVDLYTSSGYEMVATEQHGSLRGIRFGRDLG
jgi:ribosomal protein S18 acetylase RimI-like enzyme